MRSGNTLLRKYLESITGITTGSIYPNFYSMNFSLLSAGFKGETHLDDDSVWVFKAHHPFLFSQVSNPKVKKVLVCVRNPLDVIVSYVLQRLTQTHTKSTANRFFKENPKAWDEYVIEMARLWNEYNAYWHEVAKKIEVPVLFFRYEDLLMDSYSVLTDIFRFLLGASSIQDTYL